MSIIFSGRKNLDLTKVEGADINKRVMTLILSSKLFQMESMVNRLACKLAIFLFWSLYFELVMHGNWPVLETMHSAHEKLEEGVKSKCLNSRLHILFWQFKYNCMHDL